MASDIIGSSAWASGTTRLIATQNANAPQIELVFIGNQSSNWPYPGIRNPYGGGKIVWLLSKKPVSELTSTYTFDPDTDITGYSSLSINPNVGNGGPLSTPSWSEYGPGSGGGVSGEAAEFYASGGGVYGYRGYAQNGSWYAGQNASVANSYSIRSITQLGQNGYNSLAIGIINYWTIEPLATATNQAITEAAVGAPSAKSVNTRLTFSPVVLQPLSNQTVNASQLGTTITATILNYYNQPISWTFDNGSGPVPLDSLYNVTNVAGPTYTSTVTKKIGAFYEGDSGTYTCTVTPVGGSPVSSSMVLTVNPCPPVISSITGGSTSATPRVTTTLTAVLSLGSLPLTYVWYFKSINDPNYNDDTVLGLPIFNQTKNSYTILSSSFMDSGKYSCKATNDVGSSTATTILKVVGIPFLQNIPSQTVLPNKNVLFVCNATGTPPLTYQWNWNGNPITGAIYSSYTITAATNTHVGVYTCTVSNSEGSVTSNDANLGMFTLESNCLVQANTINSGSGYLSVPPTVITGGQGSGGAISLTPDRQYIRRIRITGGTKMYEDKPTVTISGGGNVGAKAVAIVTDVPTDWTIKSITPPSDLVGNFTVVYPPVTGQITGTGTGASVTVVTEPAPYGGGIQGIRAWHDMNYLSGPTDDKSRGHVIGYFASRVGYGTTVNTTVLGSPGPYAVNLPKKHADKALMAAPCYIVKYGQGLSGDVGVSSRDGNGEGCTASLSFQNITSSFQARGRYMRPFGKPSLNRVNDVGYNTVYSPVITITNPGEGYTSTPIFTVTRLQTDDQFGQVQEAWYLVNGGAETVGGFGGALIGAATIAEFPIFLYAGNSEGGQRIGEPGYYSDNTSNNIMSRELLDFVNGGPLPVAIDGGAIISRGVRVKQVNLEQIGSGYSPSNTNLVMKCGLWSPPPGNFQSAITIPSNSHLQQLTTAVTVIPGDIDYLLDAIGIESQGNGFTSTPTITVNGVGGSCTAVADMSCFAIGDMRPSNPNKIYETIPTIDISPVPNSSNFIKPVVVPIMEDSGTATDVVVNNPLLNFYPESAVWWAADTDPTNPNYRLGGKTMVERIINPIPGVGQGEGSLINPPSSNSFVTLIDGPTGVPFSITGYDAATFANNIYSYRDHRSMNITYAQVERSGVALTYSLGNARPCLSIRKLRFMQGATGYTSSPISKLMLGRIGGVYGPGLSQRLTTDQSVPPRIQTILSRKIAKIVVLDNGCGYDTAPMTGKIIRKSDGTIDTLIGSTGYASTFKASVSQKGSGYNEITSTFINAKFIQRFHVQSNGGFTSVPTVTTSDGNGSFVATINSAASSGVGLTVTNGGSGYIIYRDRLTNIVTNTASIEITPNPLDFQIASGASASPIISGSIGGLLIGNLFPAKMMPWLPDYRPSWCQDFNSPGGNKAGSGYRFDITNEPGCPGSGLSLVPVIKTAAQLGYRYKGGAITIVPYSTTSRTPQPELGANWYDWTRATPEQYAASAAANLKIKEDIFTTRISQLSVAEEAVRTGNWPGGTLDAELHANFHRGRYQEAKNDLEIARYIVANPQPNTYPMGWNLSIVSGFGNAYDFGNAWARAGCPFLVGVAISNPGSGYRAPPKIKFITDVLSVGQWDIGSYIQGPISGLSGVNPGINYTRLPTVSVNVDYNAIDNSKIYPSPMSIFPDKAPYGSGAVITPSVSGVLANTIRDIFIKDQGTGWTGDAPTITVTGPAGAVGTATPIMGASYMRIIMREGGVYTKTPSVVITEGLVNGLGKGASAVAILSTIPSGSPNAGKQSVSGVMFSSYGSAYVSPVIRFVRDPTDTPAVDATAQAEMIYSSRWPSVATAVPDDGCGSGGVFGLKVSTELCISGTIGPVSGVVQIPNTVTGILDKSFANLSGISSVVFEAPSRCRLVGDPVFENCTSLESVYIPESMEEIQSEAFLGCSNLTKVVIEGNIGPQISPDAFNGCSPDIKIYTPAGFQGFRAVAGDSNVVETVTPQIINSKPRVSEFVGTAAYKADLSDLVFNGGTITSDPAGNIYGPYFSTFSYGAYSYSLDDTYNLVNAKAILPLNTPVLNQWVPIAQVVWAGSTTSPAGGVFILGVPNYWNGSLEHSIYYKLVDSDPNEDPYLICEKLDKDFVSMAVDNVGNLILLNKTLGRDLLILTADRIAEAIATGITIEPEGFGQDNELNTEVPTAIACDSNGYIYAALSEAGIIIRYNPHDRNTDHAPVLFASGFSKPCALAFDDLDNLYVGNGDNTKLDGISVVSTGPERIISTVMNGFYVVPESLTYITPKSTLVFSDGYNLCYMPLNEKTTAPVSLIQALATHDYDQISDVIVSAPGETFILTVDDVIAINSTLSEDSQVEIPPDNPIIYISPNSDQSVTVPVAEPDTSVVVATSLPPDVSTTVTIGIDVLTIVSNSTSPPTLTVSGSGVDSTQIVGVGESFNTVSGTTVTIYSIGLTVFGAVYGAVFVPGVGGIAPSVCKPKKQGIDYGLFLSSQFFNADVQKYKQKGPVDASEWIRRKRSLNSTKFGTC